VSSSWSEVSAGGPLVFRPVGVDRVAPGARAAFLDRDGTLNEAIPDPVSGLPESPLAPADVRLLPGAAVALAELSRVGYTLVCISNQPAAAKGKATIAELLAVHERVITLLSESGVRVAASYLCPHHPDGVVAALSGRCECRKPAADMLRDAAAALAVDLESSWMFGDTDTDVAAGRAAGCRTALIEYPGSAHKRAGTAGEDVLATDVEDAVAQVLARSPE
jgi:histidinol-phosphate phosphatase family protein